MNKFKKLSIIGAVSGSFLIANGTIPPFRNAWALTQDTTDELEGKKRAGSLAAIISYLLDEADLANDDSYVVEQNTTLNVAAVQGIFANDIFSPPVDFVLVDTTTNGVLTLDTDGSFSYLPATHFTGVDKFRYALNLTNGQTSEATVTIRVNGQPEASDDTFSTLQDTALIGNVVTNSVGGSDTLFDGADVDPVTAVSTSEGGTISIVANGDFTYNPPAGASGLSDTYVYTLRDQDGETSTATITVVVNGAPVNINPIEQTVDEDTALSFNALNTNQVSVSDADTDLVSVTLSVTNGVLSVTPAGSATAPTSGSGSITINGSQADINATLASLTYQATAEFNGTDTLAILSTDATNLTDTDTVALTVTPVSDGVPIAVDDNFFTGQDEELNDNIIVNSVGGSDTIFDEADATPVVNTATTRGGTITINAGGSFTYNPPAGVIGGPADTFIYTLVDSDGQSDTATISISIDTPSITVPNNNSVGPNNDDLLVLENTTVAGTFTVSAPAGFGSLQIGSTTFTEAQLNAASVGAPLDISGEANGVYQVTSFASGVVAYNYDPAGNNQDHSAATNDVLSENLAIVLTDTNSETTSDTLNIGITDTSPVADDDARDISEGTSEITGNTVGIAGSASGDDQDTVIDPATVTDIDFGATDGTVGSPLDGDYGNMVISSAGVYTYTLDNTNTDVQGLKSGESVTEVFTYTLTDNEALNADSDTADITVTINGVEDALPTIVVRDDNAGATGESSVTEATVAPVTGLVTITATAGVQTLTVGGQDIINATAVSVVITGSEGTLTVTGFSASTGEVTYSYLEDGNAEDHSGGEILDNFAIVVADNEGDSASDSLDIQIIDTTPTAVADINSITEDAASNTVSANVITGGAGADTMGADTPLSVTAITGGTVGSSLAGTLGSLVMGSDGLYTYTLDNNNSTVQALTDGQSASDSFTYTISDDDGDTSSTTLTIIINGVDEAPTITIPNNNSVGANNDDLLIAENAAAQVGSFTIEAEAGLASVQIGSTTLTLAELVSANTAAADITGETRGALQVTGYNAGSGLIDYSYDPTGTNQDHSGASNDILSEVLSIVVTDDDGETASDTLNIGISDTTPTAANDTNSISEDAVPNPNNIAVGDVITNDTQGADTSVAVSGINFGSAQIVGTTFSSDYGTLDLNSGGTYTYTLDNSDGAVQALNAGESLTETFNYTIVDTDGDTSSTTLTITINGVNEAPLISIPDTNGAAMGDESVAENVTTTGAFTVLSLVGLHPSSTALRLTGDGVNTDLTLSQLQNLGAANQVISNTDDGNLTLMSYDLTANVTTIGYAFNPTGSNRDHSAGDDSVVEVFSIVATDADNKSGAVQDLDILIIDTNPVANDDAISMSEGTLRVSGGAVSGANFGGDSANVADTIIDPATVTDIDFGATDGTVGTPLNGDYGSMLISSSGVYTYTLDNANTDVQDLNNGESLVETFSYTITDNESPNADSDTATITVTINGVG